MFVMCTCMYVCAFNQQADVKAAFDKLRSCLLIAQRVSDNLSVSSLPPSLPHYNSLTPSLTNSLTHSLTNSLTHPLTHSLTHSPISHLSLQRSTLGVPRHKGPLESQSFQLAAKLVIVIIIIIIYVLFSTIVDVVNIICSFMLIFSASVISWSLPTFMALVQMLQSLPRVWQVKGQRSPEL